MKPTSQPDNPYSQLYGVLGAHLFELFLRTIYYNYFLFNIQDISQPHAINVKIIKDRFKI